MQDELTFGKSAPRTRLVGTAEIEIAEPGYLQVRPGLRCGFHDRVGHVRHLLRAWRRRWRRRRRRLSLCCSGRLWTFQVGHTLFELFDPGQQRLNQFRVAGRRISLLRPQKVLQQKAKIQSKRRSMASSCPPGLISPEQNTQECSRNPARVQKCSECSEVTRCTLQSHLPVLSRIQARRSLQNRRSVRGPQGLTVRGMDWFCKKPRISTTLLRALKF